MSDVMYYISLRSKYTGEVIVLGGQYNTREEAEAYGETLCHECNYVDIHVMSKGLQWKNKHEGFVEAKGVMK